MKSPHQPALVLLMSACLLACAIGEEEREPEVFERSQALIGGDVDMEDPAVVALTFSSGQVFCTGTLVSPSVILTAAHCIDDAGNDPNITAFFGTDVNGEGVRSGIARKQQHFMWDGDIANGFDYDIGMLLLSSPQNPELAVPYNNVAPASEHVGEPYRHVGFGIWNRDTRELDGKKRTGTTTITGTQFDWIMSGDDTVIICQGDSGGPGFLTIDGVEMIAGIHSWGPAGCSSPSGDNRVDLYADDFVTPWIQENDPACGADFSCARIGCTNDPDCEPCGPDGTCTSDCALPDPDCATSAEGEICQLDTQCMSGRCVFWRGDADYKFCASDCTSNSDCQDGMSCQSVAPFGMVCYWDEDPEGLLGDDCEAATDCGSYLCEDGECTRPCDLGAGLICPQDFECTSLNGTDFNCHALPQEDGGCSIGQHQGGSGSLLALFALALLFVARRRRSSLT